MTTARPACLALSLVLASACAPTKPSVNAEPAPSTRYRVGDFVVYSYTGERLPTPVTLREEIVQRQGLRLEIQVQARRGEAVRRWAQVVTDTPENQANNVVDALYALKGAERRRLDHQDPRTLYRLYAWTLPPSFKGHGESTRVSRTVSLQGRSVNADCVRTEVIVGDAPAIMETCTSPTFLWTNVLGRLYRSSDGAALWQMSVQSLGPARDR